MQKVKDATEKVSPAYVQEFEKYAPVEPTKKKLKYEPKVK